METVSHLNKSKMAKIPLTSPDYFPRYLKNHLKKLTVSDLVELGIERSITLAILELRELCFLYGIKPEEILDKVKKFLELRYAYDKGGFSFLMNDFLDWRLISLPFLGVTGLQHIDSYHFYDREKIPEKLKSAFNHFGYQFLLEGRFDDSNPDIKLKQVWEALSHKIELQLNQQKDKI